MNRIPGFAGSFYPDDPGQIIEFIRNIENTGHESYSMTGCVLPHAGWFFSGRTALKTLLSSKEFPKARLCVIFGAVHTYGVQKAVLSPSDEWETPLGTIASNMKIRRELISTGLFDDSAEKHAQEHSIEVLLPFVRYLAPDCSILPVSIPFEVQNNLDEYVSVFSKLKDEGAFFIASSDMTHYGRNYGELQYGTGEKAHAKVKEEKDASFIRLIQSGKYQEIIPYSARNRSACGAGGIALLSGIMSERHAEVIDYTTSYEMYPAGGLDSFVTYCGLGFVKNQVSL